MLNLHFLPVELSAEVLKGCVSDPLVPPVPRKARGWARWGALRASLGGLEKTFRVET
jgi:hypothetical protein